VRQYALSQNMVGGFYTSAIGFGFNTDVLKKKKLPSPGAGPTWSSPSTRARSRSRTPPPAARPTPSSRAWCSRWARTQAFDYLKKLHRNVTSYTRSGQAQAPNVAKGEVAIGVSFIFGFEKWRLDKFPGQDRRALRRHGLRDRRHRAGQGRAQQGQRQALLRLAHEPGRPAIGAKAGSLQSPANKTFKPDPRIPSMAEVKLIKYDFEKYGKAAERKRLIDRWTREVESQPR
jgi:iron(III) transport system substrate-binding protein